MTERSGLRGVLTSRFVLVPGAIVAAALAWNLYVSFHDDGIIAGRVVGPGGAPVAGATVIVFQQNVTTFSEAQRVTTDADGRFRIAGNPSHHVQLAAEKDGARSDRVTLRLYFRSQNVELDAPLRLERRG